jgi:hypothetical protein
VPRSYRFNSPEILRSLSQQHETFLKDSEEVRRQIAAESANYLGGTQVIGLTAHSILLFERPEVIGFGGQQDGW